MFEHRDQQAKSQQVGGELLEIFRSRQQSVDQSDRMIEGVTDTPEKSAAEFAQSYYETWYNTPALKMLCQAEQYLPNIAESHEFYYRMLYNDQEIFKIDLVEALSIVMPDEAWRILQTIPEGKPKIEALAKMGNNTDRVFIKQARELALKLDSYDRVSNLLKVADFARDDTALELAYQEASASSRKQSYSEWQAADSYINIASLGHGPALLEAKRLVLENFGKVKSHTYHWLEEMALVSYIDELSKRGNIPKRGTVDIDQMPDYESIESIWLDTLMKHRSEVSAELQKDVELPRFDEFSRSLYSIALDAEKCSTLKNAYAVASYVDDKAEEYAALLMSSGLDTLEGIKAAADNPGLTYSRSKEELLQRVRTFRHQWAKSLMILPGPCRSDEEEAEIYNKDNVRMFKALNRISVFRGLLLAGVGLQRGDNSPNRAALSV